MDVVRLSNFLFELSSLRNIIRSHRQFIPQANDTIADHSYRVTIIAMILASFAKADVDKVIKMCLFHDLAEARTGDTHYLNQQYVEIDEEAAKSDQLVGLPFEDEVKALLAEYEERQTLEAKIAKDADRLDQLVLEQEYFYSDATNKKRWQDHQTERLQTDFARQLAAEIRQTNPIDWWYVIAATKLRPKARKRHAG